MIPDLCGIIENTTGRCFDDLFKAFAFKRRARDKIIEIRDLVELILSKDSFLLIPEHKAKISSFIDNLGKQLNVTYKPYVYIAMYSAHLDAEIYRHFNPLIGIYDFIDYYYVEPETVARMKQYSDVSFDVLADLKLSPYKQGN